MPLAAALGSLTVGERYAVATLGGVASVFSTAYLVFLPPIVTPEALTEGNAKPQGSGSGVEQDPFSRWR